MDLEKTYDTVPRKLLWSVIRKIGIPQEIVQAAAENPDGFQNQITQ